MIPLIRYKHSIFLEGPFDDKFRDAGAVSEVKTSDVDQINRADLTRLIMTFFVQIPPCCLNINYMFFSVKTEIARSTNGTSCRISER